MSKWFFINILVLLFAVWKISTSYFGIHILFGGLGLLFILYNWTRHAVFSTIRSNISRQRKIKYAQFSKRVLPFHKWTGSIALVLISFHGFFVIQAYGIPFTNWKIVSGLFASFILVGVVLFGWLRWYHTTLRRRYIHLTLAFCLFGLVLLHLVL